MKQDCSVSQPKQSNRMLGVESLEKCRLWNTTAGCFYVPCVLYLAKRQILLVNPFGREEKAILQRSGVIELCPLERMFLSASVLCTCLSTLQMQQIHIFNLKGKKLKFCIWFFLRIPTYRKKYLHQLVASRLGIAQSPWVLVTDISVLSYLMICLTERMPTCPPKASHHSQLCHSSPQQNLVFLVNLVLISRVTDSCPFSRAQQLNSWTKPRHYIVTHITTPLNL